VEKEREEDELQQATKRTKMENSLHDKVDVNFLIIGAQKAGTTALATNLSKHPDVFVKNECQFFTFCWGFGSSWYRDQLRSNKPIIGEKTPEIIYCDDCAPRVKQVCPDAKFIFCIRDPINRAYSSWNMEIRTNKESLPFAESLERELAAPDAMRTYGTAEYHYVQRGFYMDQIERFQKTFPDRSQMLVVVAERLLSHPAEEYSRVVEFLGLSNFTFVPETDNVGDYSEKIPEKAYKKLQEIYAPHNARLFEYLGYSIPEWTSVVEPEGPMAGADDKASNPPAAEVYAQGSSITTTAPPPSVENSAILTERSSSSSSGAGAGTNILTHVANTLTSHQGLFAQIGTRTGTDKIFHHGYHRFYPPLLDRFRSVEGGGMLEIGVDESRSLHLWLEYFPLAFIYGIDIGVTKAGPRYKIMQADQSITPELQRLARDEITHPLFFIIDDGSHIPEHQVSSFDYLFGDVLLPGGTYIIEDIETSYWSRNGLYGYQTRYGYHHQYSVLEVFKDLMDDVQHEFLNHQARESQDRRMRDCVSRRTRNEINTITIGQNCILITKKTAAEHEEFDGRRYRYSKNL